MPLALSERAQVVVLLWAALGTGIMLMASPEGASIDVNRIYWAAPLSYGSAALGMLIGNIVVRAIREFSTLVEYGTLNPPPDDSAFLDLKRPEDPGGDLPASPPPQATLTSDDVIALLARDDVRIDVIQTLLLEYPGVLTAVIADFTYLMAHHSPAAHCAPLRKD